MKAFEIIKILEEFAPKAYQEEYDNSGLCIGSPQTEVNGILCTIDITMQIIEEATARKANMIISHHPLIFQGIKSITGKNEVEQIIIRAIREDIVIYSGHTNFDNISTGVNSKICEKIGLQNCEVLAPLKGKLIKLVAYVPESAEKLVREALFAAGAGSIGEYDSCSFNLKGTGTFRGNENTNPYVGTQGEIHFEPEVRIETILPDFISSQVVNALLKAHPYEDVAYDLYPLKNQQYNKGAGMIGELSESIDIQQLLKKIKSAFNANGIRYSGNSTKKIKRIAVCGGSGSFLIKNAKNAGADAFITGDIKYHQFFDGGNNLIIIDIGHFESEQYTKDIFYEVLKEKIPKFAVHLSEVNTNPLKYFN